MSDSADITPSGPFAAVILAAGKGTRMKSARHKVLHPIAGKPMLGHLMDELATLTPKKMVVVLGAGREEVEPFVTERGAAVAVQEQQLGTGHAVLQARGALAGFDGMVLACFGDVPMVRAETVARMLHRLQADEPACVVLGFRPDDPLAYGRIVADASGRIEKMVEYKDASDAERVVTLCNSGLIAAKADDMFALLDRVGNDNAQGEYYLPDMVMVAQADGRHSAVIETEPWEVAGINSRAELAAVERDWQERKRADAMAEGATLVDPSTVWFSHDTKIGRDVTIEPQVRFGPGAKVADGATIHAFSHIEGASIGEGCSVGPYARLRPGAVMEKGAKVGNFVEMKKAVLGEGAKASHLTYLGDATVGANANIGAGTITCNYDGFFKYQTEIGAGAFIGSNSALVAPVKIGEGAIVGAGSVVTKDVEADALALARGEQSAKPGWAKKFRDAMRKKKAQE
ncbi:MAG: bifunctional UDP-N-acetylglucosamine diphosphorylase/glucosamine-1-phosphate N-acetyltransferase GlmU [Parasphingopyxis sp.]|uniref:bifunctional UDP-N-acetylglucosamine diphosphorylase/glucosamine-1-phosphate N-acetyltransferase GlmU n=1 Tax=Parasphingopyxis sp. TaxID=1920299 RepID=UPI003F9FFFD4